MTFTLAWKELREHQGIWITMVCMTVGLGLGLAKVVSLGGDTGMAIPTAAITILGMAGTYGIVCGSMMFAGEHEGGTLVFLDIFLGRRGLLWAGKFAIGVLLVITQALCVAMILGWLNQDAPRWATALVGYPLDHAPGGAVSAGSGLWYLVLPVVTMEAFAWGLLGSALTRRVLAGAAIAAVGFTPIWLMAILAPGPVFFPFRVLLSIGLLVISATTFLNQSREASLGPTPPPEPETPFDPREQFLAEWDRYERENDPEHRDFDEPVSVSWGPGPVVDEEPVRERPLTWTSRSFTEDEEPDQAELPREVLWWLTVRQAQPVLWSLSIAGALLGLLFIPLNYQVLWPLFTLLLGVACGTSAFAAEQRDLSYQFLSAQHFPLKVIWRFKISFWLTVAVVIAFMMFLGTLLIAGTNAFQPRAGLAARFDGLQGTLIDRMGPMLFAGGWLVYGFCVGQLVVWLCRKSILALLVSSLLAASAIGMWLPSLLCGGMSGWQAWMPPLTLLAATSFLMRAWTGGRIWERKPMTALAGFVAGISVWALMNFGYRAWEVPNVGAPLDPDAFRTALPTMKDNAAAKSIHKAIVHYDDAVPQRAKVAEMIRRRAFIINADEDKENAKLDDLESCWMAAMVEAARFPVGVLEMPRSNGQGPLLKHLPTCRLMARDLGAKARLAERSRALDYLVQILALSRNLRNKASLESYLSGIAVEHEALDGLDHWLDRGKPDPKLLRRVLDELNRHAEETPPPLDCVRTECYRSAGLLDFPNTWTFSARDAVGKIPEQWLAGSIVLSMEMPWEAERKMRLWQIVWAGLFRAVETPRWQVPEIPADPPSEKIATSNVLKGWLPATQGPGASVTRARMIRLLDSSWLADERLFCQAARLRDAATRARWRVDSTRQIIALALYRLEEGQAAKSLQQLVPKYLPTELPLDPYSGQPFGYSLGRENGPAAIWSTGPDGIDHGGRNHGGRLDDDDPQWLSGEFDLVTVAPLWR